MTAEEKAKQICELKRLQAQIEIAISMIERNQLLFYDEAERSHDLKDRFIIGDFVISKRYLT